MGEVAVSSGGGGGGRGTPELMRETRELPRKQDGTIMNDAGDGSGAAVGAATTTTATATTTNNVVRWDKFLPRMVLRVLLVEADDSTRQIICALLRKCSYRVAAVSDGLKAWEVLKGRPHNIDLILTEVELPSISGFALLTLIMEHEICKSIPVIMMSAHDSVSTVYKCMLRGAADFLVKPVRKNELKNLWQHVWRRQASTSGGNGLQEESDCQQKVEATAENNATSNHSSGYMACIKLNRECIEKGSDAQSSCTKPDMEAEGLHMEQVKDLSNSRWTKSPSSDMKAQKFEQYDKTTDQLKTNENEAEGSAMGDVQKEDRNTQEKGMAMGVRWERVNIVNPDLATGDPPREAIDLIGSFDSFPKSSYKRSINCGANKVDHPSPMLDLSLRRSHPSSSVNQISDERHRLKQSDASAFSRYVNKTQPSLPSGSASISNQQKDCETNSNKQLSKNVTEYNSDTHSVPVGDSQRNMVSSHGQAEIQSQFPSPKQGVFPVPVPMRGLRFENQCATYGSVLPPIFCLQPGLSPMQSPGSSGNQEPSSFQANPYYMSNLESRNGTQEHHNLMVDRKASDETENKEEHKMETMDDRGHFSSATDHSTSSGFCNGGTLSRLNSVGSGSNGHVNLVSDGNNAHRSIQREAALNKFRMKRKDRCYEKKVRYESRKKLAEQRPRVKGQFVRQVQISSPSPMEADRECGNSSPG